ncbi:unnamed protein product [Alopecurus aequalis]
MPDSGGSTVLDDLPESIVVEEILFRLPPKDLLRCGAVRKCWYSATSTDKFMLDHHRRQPLLPIISHGFGYFDQRKLLFVPRAGQQKLCPVLRSSRHCEFHAALDGLLILSTGDKYFICNPVTRKCASLPKPQVQGDSDPHIASFFRHQPSGEYRVLWADSQFCDPGEANRTMFCYVLAVGSSNPRCVRHECEPYPTAPPPSPSLEVELWVGLPRSSNDPPVHHHGSLHWKLRLSCIMELDTTSEIFRLMSSPTQLRAQELLLEMDGALAFCSIGSNRDTIDVWVMQDYDAEIWSFKHRINLSVVDPPSRFDSPIYMAMFPKMAVLNEGELLLQFNRGLVLHYDVDGKFLGYVISEEDRNINLRITGHYLQESVIPLPLFHETGEEDEPTFFVGL